MAAIGTKVGPAAEPARRPGGFAEPAAPALVATGGAALPVAIPLRPGTFRTLAGRPDAMAELIEGYGAALERSRRSGRPVRFVVDVTPHGAPRITPAEADAPGSADLERALAAARDRGRQRVADILREPEMLNADAFADLIGISRMSVNAKRQKRQLLGLDGAKRGFRFPAWQIDRDGKPFAALPALFDRLGGNPWTVYRFLVQHHPELGGVTGREALHRGRDAAVLAAAESVARDFT